MFDPADLKRLHEAATDAPWKTHETWPHEVEGPEGFLYDLGCDDEGRADAALIVYLRNHVEELLAAMECKALLENFQLNRAVGTRTRVESDRMIQEMRRRIDAALQGGGEGTK